MRSTSTVLRLCMTAVFMSLLAASATAANFVTATPTAPHRGVWQIELSLDAPGGNPFLDVELDFIFTLPDGKEVKAEGSATCRLHLPEGGWRIRWFDPRNGQWHANPERKEISGGYTRDFKSPFPGDAVLLLTLP